MKVKPVNQNGNSHAAYWEYFGTLHDDQGKILTTDRYYCRICLEEQQKLSNGNLSDLCNFASNTSSGNMNGHLFRKHNISVFNADEKCKRVTEVFKKYSAEQTSQQTSAMSS